MEALGGPVNQVESRLTDVQGCAETAAKTLYYVIVSAGKGVSDVLWKMMGGCKECSVVESGSSAAAWAGTAERSTARWD